jgi:hypothetical protein
MQIERVANFNATPKAATLCDVARDHQNQVMIIATPARALCRSTVQAAVERIRKSGD